jgi:hypothetical protein
VVPRKIVAKNIVGKNIVGAMAAIVVGVGLTVGVAPAVGATTSAAATTKSAEVSANCAQLRKRLLGAPATLRRVDANVEELRTRLAVTRHPVRRAVLEERIRRLEQLRAELQVKITQARAACSAPGSNTT